MSSSHSWHGCLPGESAEGRQRAEGEPLWGDTTVQAQSPKLLAPCPFAFTLADGERTLLLAEWEWDTGVGVLLGAPYTLRRDVMQIRASDGAVLRRFMFGLEFRNGFILELQMDYTSQQVITPTVVWPGGAQRDYKPPMNSDDLLALCNQVMGQLDERFEQ